MPKGEEAFVHAVVWKKEFDRNTGEPKFKPFKQKYSPQEWIYFLRYPHGFVVNELLHLPEGSPAPEGFETAPAKK